MSRPALKGFVAHLDRRGLRLTEEGLAEVRAAFARSGAVGWCGPGCVRVIRVDLQRRAVLAAELEEIIARTAEWVAPSGIPR